MPKTRRRSLKIDREDSYELTGLTTAQRNAEVARLHKMGWSQARIAGRLGVTQPAVHYALKRLAGIPRNRSLNEACDWCGEKVPPGGLDDNGCCEECRRDD